MTAYGSESCDLVLYWSSPTIHRTGTILVIIYGNELKIALRTGSNEIECVRGWPRVGEKEGETRPAAGINRST